MTTTFPPIRWEPTRTDGSWRAAPMCLVSGPAPGTYVAAPEPVLMCADCLYPLAAHDDGRCLDILGDPAGAYRFLPLGRFADLVVRDVADSWGRHLYVFTLGGMWEPPYYTVRGDSFGDAWEWFMGYAAARDLLDDRTEYLDADERAAWERGDGLDGLEMVDGYPGLYDVSGVDGWQIR